MASASAGLCRRCGLVAGAVVVLGLATVALAQRRSFMASPPDPGVHHVDYDGRFAFARLQYTTGPGGYYYGGRPAWAHGFDTAERNLMHIANEATILHPHLDEGAVLSLDDPELCRYPVAYMTEAGYWTLTDAEAAAFRAYLLKGGFVIFDDFREGPRGGGGWDHFAANMRRVLPDARFIDLVPTHPIFHSFFEIGSFDIIPQDYDRGRPVFRGVFEGNDPSRRLMAIVNFNTDVSNYWELSATGYQPIDESNKAYKLGINYLIYGLTH